MSFGSRSEDMAHSCAEQTGISTSFIAEQTQTLASKLNELVEQNVVPGIGALISISGARIEAYAGAADRERDIPFSSESRFEISCLMKFFLSTLAIGLADKRFFDIDTPVVEILPELEATNLGAGIRVRHLLSHTSGYRGVDITKSDVRWRYTWTKLFQHLQAAPQLFAPGTVFNYEHTEHVLLGEIIRRTTGNAPANLVFDELFQPLGVEVMSLEMMRTSDRCAVSGYAVGPQAGSKAGRFVSLPPNGLGPFWEASLSASKIRLRDVISISEAMLSGNFRALPVDIFDRLGHPIIGFPETIGPTQAEEMPASFGLGCSQYGPGVIGHNFSTIGQACSLRIIPEQRVSVVVGTNTWAPHVRDSVMRWIINAFSDTPSRNGEARSVSAKSILGGFQLRELEGVFYGSYWGEIHVRALENALHASRQGPNGRISLFELRQIGSESLILSSLSPMNVCFFRYPCDGTPCLAVGMHSYKKAINF